jgi:arylsulfatase A-like enzyme
MKSSINISVVLLAGFVAGCTTERQAGEIRYQTERPNVLFFFTDDQQADALGCAGNSIIKTPNIDNLATNGMRFTNCYVMGGHHGAICAPSRAMLLTGKSLFHVYENLAGEITMPMHFASQGYETFGTGKWHNTAKSFETSFQKGKNVFLDGMSDHFKVPCRDLDEEGKLTKPMDKGFSTDLFAEAAIDFINDYAAGERENPFFCYISYTAPHDPRSPREDYIGMYSDEEMPLPGNFMKLHPFEFDDLNIRDETLGAWPRTPDMVRASLADYYALISHIDKTIGDIIETLKKHKLHENTIIIFASDNGLAVGSHGLLGKQNLYEHSTKVPFIISGPGIPKGSENDALVYLFDIFPTLSALCRLPEPEQIDGKDLLPVIHEKAADVRTSLYTAYRNTVRAVRDEEWKLIWYPRINHTQLFNLKDDADEINNLAYISGYEPKVKEMMNLLTEWYVVTGDTATLFPSTVLPLEYDYKKLKQTPDRHQPEYVLERYFRE